MANKDDKHSKLKELLDAEHSWPCEYMFKFIVPHDKEKEVCNIFPYETVSLNFSKRGKYVGITVILVMESAEAVLQVYEAASQIKGLIAL